MMRWLGLAIAVYAPHLVEEALTGMHDDPLIVTAFAPLSHLSPRHASYLVFQIMLGLALGLTYLFSRGGRARLGVMSGLAVALLCESHHVVRALWTLHYDSGLITSPLMPVVGALIAREVWRQRRQIETQSIDLQGARPTSWAR